MKTKGIRILDGKGNVLDVKLSDILEEISNGDSLYWSILFLDGMPNPGKVEFLSIYENQINKSKNGLRVNWEDLTLLSSKFFQMFETTILGCKDMHLLHRYKNDEEMYKACDIVIDLIDCAFWEVYSKDQTLIQKLKEKFNEVELLSLNSNDFSIKDLD